MALPDDVLRHYEGGVEAGRLEHGPGQVERDRAREIVLRYAPPPPAVIMDIGGGPGAHAVWLVEQGYTVHLVDATPLHVEQARTALGRAAASTRWSAVLGDARTLDAKAESADVVLLFGPLYHLTERADRVRALGEACRVVRKGGVVLAAAISRFASALDGMARHLIDDADFLAIVADDLAHGQHRNPKGVPDYFATAYFHRPEELSGELTDAGLRPEIVVGLEGPTWLLPDIGERWADEARRATLSGLLRQIEHEPALLGMSAHLVAVGRKPA